MPPKKKIVFLLLAIKIGLTTMCLCGCGILVYCQKKPLEVVGVGMTSHVGGPASLRWSYFALSHHMDHKECALANLIYDLVKECKIIRVRFERFYLLIIDTFFWWSYFALPHHMDHKECALANLMYDLVIECKIIRV
jgi:hypothetical protein